VEFIRLPSCRGPRSDRLRRGSPTAERVRRRKKKYPHGDYEVNHSPHCRRLSKKTERNFAIKRGVLASSKTKHNERKKDIKNSWLNQDYEARLLKVRGPWKGQAWVPFIAKVKNCGPGGSSATAGSLKDHMQVSPWKSPS